ncbi:MAG: hypothetical protein FJ197_11100 [Gammaproteobacteria bacterium]|nr:hypothetical protein [Gammaproteobacteria bacterium]
MRAAAAIGWSSFLAACVGTMLIFAAVDPQVLIDGYDSLPSSDTAAFWLSHTGIYTIGFFLLWGVAALAALIAVTLAGDQGQ